MGDDADPLPWCRSRQPPSINKPRAEEGYPVAVFSTNGLALQRRLQSVGALPCHQQLHFSNDVDGFVGTTEYGPVKRLISLRGTQLRRPRHPLRHHGRPHRRHGHWRRCGEGLRRGKHHGSTRYRTSTDRRHLRSIHPSTVPRKIPRLHRPRPIPHSARKGAELHALFTASGCLTILIWSVEQEKLLSVQWVQRELFQVLSRTKELLDISRTNCFSALY